MVSLWTNSLTKTSLKSSVSIEVEFLKIPRNILSLFFGNAQLRSKAPNVLRPEYSIYILRVYTGWKEQRIGRVKDQLRKQKTQSQRLESWMELPTTIPDDHPQVTDWSLAAS